MAGRRVTKRANYKDGDFILLHREPMGAGVPKIVDGTKLFGMTVRDFLSDIPYDPVTDTDCPNSGIENTLLRPVMYDAGAPPLADVDRIVTVTDMIVGAYVIAAAIPLGGGAMNVTVSLTDAGASDTPGTVDIVGTDIDDQVLLETITPVVNDIVQGTRAFKTVVSVTGVGWIISEGNDQITVGFGDLIGLPDLLPQNTVLFGIFNDVREAVAAVTFSLTVLALNTADMTSATNGSDVQVCYLVW